MVWQRDLGNSNTAIMFSYSNNAGVSWTPYVLTTVYNNTDPNPVIESKGGNTLVVFSNVGLSSYYTIVPSPNVNNWLPNYDSEHIITHPTLSEYNGSFLLAYTSNDIIYSRIYIPDEWLIPINVSSIFPGNNLNKNPILSHSPGSRYAHLAWGLTTSTGNKRIIYRSYDFLNDSWSTAYSSVYYGYQELPSLSSINEGLFYVLFRYPSSNNYYLSKFSDNYWRVPQFIDDTLRRATLSESKFGSCKFEKVRGEYIPYNLFTGSAYIPKEQEINPEDYYYRSISIQDSLGSYFSLVTSSLKVISSNGLIRNINIASPNESNIQFNSLLEYNEFILNESDDEIIFDYEIESKGIMNLYNENYNFTPKLKIMNNEYPLEFSDENKKFQKVISLSNLTKGSKNIAKINFDVSNLKEGVFYSIGHIQDYTSLIVNKDNENAAAKSITDYNVFQNYPNPFNPLTKIHYTIPKQGLVSIKVYDILGKEITQLVNEVKQPGKYEVVFDGSNLSSGLFLSNTCRRILAN